jgi:hypothetical protein
MTAPTVTKKGRPLGAINGEHSVPQWEPKTWKPIHNLIVSLHVLGYKNVRIVEALKAENVNISTMMVSLVLNSKQGKERLRTETQAIEKETIKDRLDKLSDRALKVMETVINNDDLVKYKPLSMFDKAQRVLQHTGHLRSENDKNNGITSNTLIGNMNVLLSGEIGERLMEGLQLVKDIQDARNAGHGSRFGINRRGSEVKEITGPGIPQGKEKAS